MKWLTILIVAAGALALAVKIYLHFKMLDPKHRNIIQLGRYLGIDFFLPVTARFDSRHLRSRKAQANRMLVVFYACALLVAYLVLTNYSNA